MADMVKYHTAVEIDSAVKQAGKVPAGLQRWAKEKLHPHVDWRKELRTNIRNSIAQVAGNQDYSRSRPPRRRPVVEGFVPHRLVSPVPKVSVVVDTSGSMSDKELGQALGEIDGVLRHAMPGQEITVIAVDAAVGACKKVARWQQVELAGGGGTDMGVGIKAAQEQRPKPDIVIVLTDGYTPWPASGPPGMKVIVGVIGAKDRGDDAVSAVPSWAKPVPIPVGKEDKR